MCIRRSIRQTVVFCITTWSWRMLWLRLSIAVQQSTPNVNTLKISFYVDHKSALWAESGGDSLFSSPWQWLGRPQSCEPEGSEVQCVHGRAGWQGPPGFLSFLSLVPCGLSIRCLSLVASGNPGISRVGRRLLVYMSQKTKLDKHGFARCDKASQVVRRHLHCSPVSQNTARSLAQVRGKGN